MTIHLSKEGCQKNNISIAEALLMLAVNNNADLDIAHNELIKKGYMTADRNDLFQQTGWRLTKKGIEVIDSVIIDSDEKVSPETRLTALAQALKDIYPKGKKDGTNYYWADGVAIIIRRLKLFFKKYGDIYTDKQIIQATEKYVKGFNGNYRYMRLLKYFILKEKVDVAGDIDGDSELISYIENAGQEESLRDDWTSTLR